MADSESGTTPSEARNLPGTPQSRIGRDGDDVRIGTAKLHVTLDEKDESFALLVFAWIERAATAVASYYDEFPFDEARILIRTHDGRGISGGRASATDLPTVRIDVGQRSTARDFQRDWRMTHEMVHFAFPEVGDRHHWIEEGLATYVEPLARARIGGLTEEDLYDEWLHRMHQGQPQPGEGGLDETSTWARTYWGGALFCFAADIEIRSRTRRRYGLRDALRAILKAGGRLDTQWPLRRALEVGDAATGVSVLVEHYEAARRRPVRVDLEGIYRRLGIRSVDGRVAVDDDSDHAALRRALIFG
jgi:hypothetical protein